ncbi:MAG: hypothetical protein AAGI01_19155, partial [Myxococcota bacterium]
CVHEHQHVEQARAAGSVRFAARYVLSPVQRALFEAEATRCELELRHWRGGPLPSPAQLVARLGDYGVDARAQHAALGYYLEAIPDVRRGNIRTPSAAVALDVLSTLLSAP